MKNEFIKNVENRQKISGRDSNEFFAPDTIEKALEVINDHNFNVQIIAGGTDIMVERFEELYEVVTWMALDNITELKKIKIKDNKLEIGAGATHNQLVNSEKINNYLPSLKDAALDVGSPQIRNRGTIGGNIVTSSPAGDLLPVLLIYDAEFEIVSTEGKRTIAASNFFTGVKSNKLKDNELLTKILIGIPDENNFDKWIKIGKRKALVISSISLAVRISLDDDLKNVEKAAIAMGAVAPTPLKIEKAGEKMHGKNYAELEFEKIASIVEKEISPIDDIRGTANYRSDVAYNITIRALEDIENQIKGC